MVCCCFGGSSCVFCNIKEVAATRIVAETDNLIAFWDRSPASQFHFLVIPRHHVQTIKDLDAGDAPLLSEMINLGKRLLKDQGHNADDSFQTRMGFHVPPFNSINHLHMHVIGLPFKSKWRYYKYQVGYPWYTDAKSVLKRLVQGQSPV